MSLLNTVYSANQSNDEHKVTIMGVNNMANVDIKANYNISMNYDSNGYINIITISII